MINKTRYLPNGSKPLPQYEVWVPGDTAPTPQQLPLPDDMTRWENEGGQL